MPTGRGVKAGDAFVMIGAVDATGQVLNKVSSRFRNLGAQITQLGQAMTIGIGALALPTSIAVRQFSDFDDSIHKVRARAAGTAKAFHDLVTQTRMLGRSTTFTASAIADLDAKLGQKGFSRSDIQIMSPDILNLARGAGEGEPLEDLRMAGDLTGSIIRQFKSFEAKDSRRIADAVTAAVNNSNLTLQDVREGLKFVGPLIDRYGSTLEETLAMLGMLGDVSLESGIAGRGMRRVLAVLSDPEKELALQETLNRFGFQLNFEDAEGNIRKVHDVLFDLGRILERVSSREAIGELAQFFGTEALSPGVELAFGEDRFLNALSKIEHGVKNNEAFKTAELQNESLGASFKITVSAITDTAIAFGEVLKPAIVDVSETIKEFLNSMTEFIEKNPELVSNVVLAGVGIGALGVGFLALGTTFTLTAGLVSFFATTLSSLAIGVMAFASSPVGLAVAALVGLGSQFDLTRDAAKSLFDTVSNWSPQKIEIIDVNQTKTDINDIFSLLSQDIQTGDISGAFEDAFLSVELKWKELLLSMSTVWENFVNKTSKMLSGMFDFSEDSNKWGIKIEDTLFDTNTPKQAQRLVSRQENLDLMSSSVENEASAEIAALEKQIARIERLRETPWLDRLKKSFMSPSKEEDFSLTELIKGPDKVLKELREEIEKTKSERKKELQRIEGLQREEAKKISDFDFVAAAKQTTDFEELTALAKAKEALTGEKAELVVEQTVEDLGGGNSVSQTKKYYKNLLSEEEKFAMARKKADTERKAALEEELSLLKSQLSTLPQKDVDSLRGKIDQIEEQIEAQRKLNEQIKEEKKLRETELPTKKERLAQLQEQEQSGQLDMHEAIEARNEIEQLKKEIQELEAAPVEIGNIEEMSLQDVNSQIAEIEAELQTLRLPLTTAQEVDLSHYEKSLANAVRLKEEAQRNIDRIKANPFLGEEESRNQIAGFQDDLDRASESIDYFREKRENLLAQAKRQTLEGVNLGQVPKSKQEEIDRLEEQKTELEAAPIFQEKLLQDKIREIENEIEVQIAVNAETEGLKKQIEQIEKQIREAEGLTPGEILDQQTREKLEQRKQELGIPDLQKRLQERQQQAETRIRERQKERERKEEERAAEEAAKAERDRVSELEAKIQSATKSIFFEASNALFNLLPKKEQGPPEVISDIVPEAVRADTLAGVQQAEKNRIEQRLAEEAKRNAGQDKKESPIEKVYTAIQNIIPHIIDGSRAAQDIKSKVEKVEGV